VAAREPVLNPLLAHGEPVQRTVEVVLVGVLDRQLRGQRRARKRPRHRELRPRTQQPLHHHRQHQVPLARGLAVDQAHKLEPPGEREQRLDVAGRQRTLDLERLVPLDVALAAQKASDQLDQRGRQVRQVGERLLLDLAALAIGAAQELGVVLAIPPPDRVCDHMHRARRPRSSPHTATLPPAPDT
jgi:hypothetical protein